MSQQTTTTTAISMTSTGDAIPAVDGAAVYLFSGFLVSSATLTLQILDNASGAALTGAMTMIAGVPFQIPEMNSGQAQLLTTKGNSLNFAIAGSGTVSGWIQTIQT